MADQEKSNGGKNGQGKTSAGYQFGTFKGVFLPSILTVLGVIMYLRLGWVLGNLGLPETLFLITLAVSITFLTALSISELATNMRIGGGGAYYIISRSLGVEAGAAIGIPLFLAQALGIAFYIAGFSESLGAMLPDISPVIIGLGTLIVLTILAYISADIALKAQIFILTLIAVSLLSFFLGGSDVAAPASNVIVPEKESFWFVFAVFFPAVTGIEAGLAMSGDLKSPERSLPLGTLAAILLSYCVYMAIPIVMTIHHVSSDALLTNTMIMRDTARWGNLVVCGLWGAALSSSLGALLGAPRTLQALAKDNVLPAWIGRGYGKSNDPRLATAISFGVAAVGIILGDINVIAPILSMFFLTSYGLLNLSAGLEGLIDNPSWRPKFRVHWLWPMGGAVGCLMVMLMISPGATFLATLVSGIVYYIMQRRRLNAYWGDMRYGILMLFIRWALYKLSQKKTNEKTWRPNIMVLSGSPSTRWHLIALADAISHGKGFLTVVAVIPDDVKRGGRIASLEDSITNYLTDRHVPALVKVMRAESVFAGAKSLVLNYGFGPLVPNTILLGAVEDEENVVPYADVLLQISARQRNLVIVDEKLDVTPSVPLTPRIDLWWRGEGGNSGLMLALAYLLKTSPEWARSRLVIKTIVNSEEVKVEQDKQMRNFIESENMAAELRVIVSGDRDYREIMQEESHEASIVFLGMRPPAEDETSETYGAYYQQLIRWTEVLPTTVLVLASEKVNFDGIFKLRQSRI